MSKQLFVFIAVVFISTYLESVSAIKCYQCKSLTDVDCNNAVLDERTHIQVVDCSVVPKPNTGEEYLPVTKCNKMTTSDRIGSIVSRGCHFEVIGQKPNECRVTDARTVDSCYVCTGDGCNRDTTKTPSTSGAPMNAVGVLAIFAAILSAISMRLVL